MNNCCMVSLYMEDTDRYSMESVGMFVGSAAEAELNCCLIAWYSSFRVESKMDGMKGTAEYIRRGMIVSSSLLGSWFVNRPPSPPSPWSSPVALKIRDRLDPPFSCMEGISVILFDNKFGGCLVFHLGKVETKHVLCVAHDVARDTLLVDFDSPSIHVDLPVFNMLLMILGWPVGAAVEMIELGYPQGMDVGQVVGEDVG